MQFDFSHLYKSKQLNFGKFSVTITEIPHGAYADAQDSLLAQSEVKELSKEGINSGMVNGLRTGKMSISQYNDVRTIGAIKSWTLKTVSGDDVPVCIEAYRQLPHMITEKIEKGIKELNPTLDDDFPAESGSEGES